MQFYLIEILIILATLRDLTIKCEDVRGFIKSTPSKSLKKIKEAPTKN